jgi:adenosylcobinamide-GDP ribazoletransferase
VGFWTAWQFLTIIPPPFGRKTAGAGNLGASLAYFPAIGLLSGIILYLADRGLTSIFAPAVSNALTLALWVAISGAMHLGAVADTCDGLAGGTPARRLEIMSDSHIGSYGAAGIAIVLLIKYAAINALPSSLMMEAWLLAPVLSNWAMVFAIYVFPYAHKNRGIGQPFKQGAVKARFITATLFTLATAVFLCGWLGLALTVGVCLITAGIGAFFKRRLGGLTGDIYGTIKELNEAFILILIPAIAAFA